MKPSLHWVVLSDGAKPTEDIYFLESVAPVLRSEGACIEHVVASRFIAAAWLKGRDFLSRYAGANLLLCRSLPPSWLAWLARHRHAFGYVVYLIDDDIAAAADDVTLPAAYRQRMAGIAKRQPSVLALCDEVVACSDALAARFSERHANVSVLTPPLIAPLPALEHFDEPPSVHSPWQIGFHSTRAHLQDLLHITPALRALLNARQDSQCEVMLGKHTPPALASLAPLLQTPFNKGKSFIKFLDIAAMGGVGIYSNRYPYTEVVRHGENGLLVGDAPDEWRAALQQLINDPQTTADMARQAAIDAQHIGDPQLAVRFWQGRQH